MDPADSVPDSGSERAHLARRRTDRISAVAEVALCSSYPTQVAIALVMTRAGYVPFEAGGRLSMTYVFMLAVADTVALTAIIFLLLHLHGESARAILLGHRPALKEALLGGALIPVVFGLVLVAMLVLQQVAPWLHNLPRNPLEDLIHTPRDAVMFAVVAVAGGGVREEIQRAFILHRFEQYLGGGWMGVIVFSSIFGAGHVIQGWDVAITTGVLGAFWGVVYLKRRSILASVVSHSGFNAAEILRYSIFAPG